jgi:hypothetical protein
LLKLHGWPTSPSVDHWRAEIGSFQKNAARRFAPSMRQRLDVAKLYRDAVEQLEGLHYDDMAGRLGPVACPFTLDELLGARRAALEAALEAPFVSKGNPDQAMPSAAAAVIFITS